MALTTASCVPDSGRPDRSATAFLQIIGTELDRPSDGPGLASLIEASRVDHEFLRRTAVRSLGRLENPELVDEISARLDDPSRSVRVAAANAMAQAVHRSDGAPALAPLLRRASAETDPSVRGVVASALGRLQLNEAQRSEVLGTLLDMTQVDGGDAPVATMVGVSLGLESFARGAAPGTLGERVTGRLANLAAYDLLENRRGGDGARVRLLALMTLGQAGALTPQLVEPALRDPNAEVRTVAAGRLGVFQGGARPEFIRRALLDSSMGVRIAAVRQLAGEPKSAAVCSRLAAVSTTDDTPAVRVLALDALGTPCPDIASQTETLLGAASTLGPETLIDWQVSAHALRALARIAPELATGLLPTFVQHRNPFVRAYAAATAGILGREDILRSLADDPVPNVRAAVIGPLSELGTRDLDELLVAQLSSDDPQLLMTTAGLLAGSELGFVAASAGLSAFERVSRARRDTSRDARLALLSLVSSLGERSMTDRLEPFLNDFDATVAAEVSTILSGWNGRAFTAEPQARRRSILPSAAQLRELERTSVILHMLRGGEIVIDPLPYLATSNAFRFVRLAREGYFDGLTFHRWAPNFVIQGGSPGANEFSGAGPYSRDEVGSLPHWRGTVGLSTRGHDTGDAQIFVNLVSNVRLDHDYTIYGVVQRGMSVVDAVLEGDVILRAEVRTAG